MWRIKCLRRTCLTAWESALLALDCASAPCCDLIGSCEGKLNFQGACHFIGEGPSIGGQASENGGKGQAGDYSHAGCTMGLSTLVDGVRDGRESTPLWLLLIE